MPKVGHLSKKRIAFAHWAPDQGFFLSGGSGGSLCLELICLGPVFLQSHEEIPSHVCLELLHRKVVSHCCALYSHCNLEPIPGIIQAQSPTQCEVSLRFPFFLFPCIHH